MNNESDVFFINTHAKGRCRYDNIIAGLIFDPPGQRLALDTGGKFGVERLSANAFVSKGGCELLALVTGDGIYYPRYAFRAFTDLCELCNSVISTAAAVDTTDPSEKVSDTAIFTIFIIGKSNFHVKIASLRAHQEHFRLVW
jgi:hypothetical protein